MNGSVYFDVLKYNKTNHYGILSGRNIEDSINNTRDLDGQSGQKNPQDFALWKKQRTNISCDGRHHGQMGFQDGILNACDEYQILGRTFDIHGGGIDLKFPHHECELHNVKPGSVKTL